MTLQLPELTGTKIIAAGHRARHGKNTFTRALADRWNFVREYAFADALRVICRVNFGMTEKDPALLQKVGSQYREGDPDVWIKALHWRINEDRPKWAVISDLRYINEAQWVKSQGGITVKITRYNSDGSIFVSDDRDPTHPSEHNLDHWDWDYILLNTDTPQALAMEAESLALREFF